MLSVSRKQDRRAVFCSSARVFWGAERSMVSLAGHIGEYESTVVVSCSPAVTRAVASDSPGSKVVEINNSRPRLIRAVMAGLATLKYSNSAIIIFDIDLLPITVFTKWVHALRGNQVVFDLHDFLPTRWGRFKLRVCLLFTDKVVAVSNFVAVQVPKRIPVSVLARPMSDIDFVDESGFHSNALGVFGRISRDKNFDRIGQVLDALPERFKIVVRGEAVSQSDKAYLAEVKEDLASRGQLGRVVFEGHVDRKNLYSGVGALLLLNDAEPSGRVVAEAQLAGCPPFVSCKGGASEYVEDGMSGFVYNEVPDQSLLHGVESLFRTEKEYNYMRVKCRAYAAEKYDPVRQTNSYRSALTVLRNGG